MDVVATDSMETPAFFAEAGTSRHGARSAGAGLRWPTSWQRPLGGGRLVLAWEAGLVHWSVPQPDGDSARLLQAALVPVFRWQPDEGRSPWFVEAGIGLSLLDRPYRGRDGDEQSTRWNFQDVLAVGRLFGGPRGAELSLRLAHSSNAGLRLPNPGIDRLTLRWSVGF